MYLFLYFKYFFGWVLVLLPQNTVGWVLVLVLKILFKSILPITGRGQLTIPTNTVTTNIAHL